MQAGKLRHRIRIEKYDDVRDEAGEVVQDPVTGEVSQEWVLVDEVWAEIKPLSAREFIAAAATQSAITAHIVIRYRDGLDASMRITHKNKIYNPAGFLADKVSGLEYITIPVTEGASQSGQ